MKKISALITVAILFSFTACDKEDINPNDDSSNNDTWPQIDITIGDPTFTVNTNSSYNLFRVAYTGEKLWAIEDPDGGSNDNQRLIELNPTNGEIISTVIPTGVEYFQMFSLDYANGKLMDASSSWGENRFVSTYDPNSGQKAENWNYSGKYEIYYNITSDGNYYWAGTNYNCEGYNCQAMIKYDLNGNVVEEFDGNWFEDVLYANEHLWVYIHQGELLKLTTNFDTVSIYNITNYEKFGEAQYANELPIQLEFIENKLWLIDRYNNFYKTELE